MQASLRSEMLLSPLGGGGLGLPRFSEGLAGVTCLPPARGGGEGGWVLQKLPPSL